MTSRGKCLGPAEISARKLVKKDRLLSRKVDIEIALAAIERKISRTARDLWLAADALYFARIKKR